MRPFVPVPALLLMVACLAPDFDQDGFDETEDCNDRDGFVNPEAEEWCNGVDDDCDGVIDENNAPNNRFTAFSVFVDLDGDGFGLTETERLVCGGPMTGLALQGGDCDDTDWRIKPGGTGCGGDFDCDGVPEPDCEDWNPDDGSTTGTLTLSTDQFHAWGVHFLRSTWKGQDVLYVGGDSVGFGVVAPGRFEPLVTVSGDGTSTDYLDLDGDFDRHGDLLLIGGPSSVSSKGRGAVVLVDVDNVVSQSGTSVLSIPPAAQSAFSADLPGFGAEVATIDPTAVDAPTFAAAAPTADGGTVLWLAYRASPPGFTEHSRITGTDDLGSSLVVIDLDGDGSTELAAGAPEGTGGVWLFPASLSVGEGSASEHGTFLAGSGGRAGHRLAAVGDVTGDGRPDLAVATDDGRIHLVSDTAPTALADRTTLTDTSGQALVASRGGDLNNDGTDDLVVGMPDSHRIGVVFGPITTSGPLTPDVVHVGIPPQNTVPPTAGASQAGLGDWNGDGVDDLFFHEGANVKIALGPL